MKNKGFTLIELLGVFAFLAIISLIVLPSATGLLKSSKKNDKKRFESDIFLATEAYVESNSDSYDGLKVSGGVDYVSIAELINSGFLSKNLVDPNTKDKIDRNKSVKITKNNDQFDYEIIDKDYSTSGYIKDGLILHYDGYKAPYSKNGNKYWRDLSDNKNDGLFVNLNNSIVYKQNNGYEFTNNADYIESIENLGLGGNPNYTFEVVFKTTGFQNSNHTIIGLGWFGNTGVVVGGTTTIEIMSGKLRTEFVQRAIEKTITLNNTIHSASVTKTVGNLNTTTTKLCYDNDCSGNTLYGSETAVNLLDSKLQIGRSWQYGGQNKTLNGILYSVRVYNRALTQSEITQNYNIDKIRFGI